MGNIQSTLKHYFYITSVYNKNLPLVPFVHLIVKYNNQEIGDVSPLDLKECLKTQNLKLEVLDILLEKSFTVVIPMFEETGDQKLGISIVKINTIPTLLKIRVLSIKESADTLLQVNDQILGIDKEYCETEDELLMQLRESLETKLVVARDRNVLVIINKGPELGCEVGMGIVYSMAKAELCMDGYTSIIQKTKEDVNEQANISDIKEEISLNNTKPAEHQMEEINNTSDNTKEVQEDKSIQASGDIIEQHTTSAEITSNEPLLYANDTAITSTQSLNNTNMQQSAQIKTSASETALDTLQSDPEKTVEDKHLPVAPVQKEEHALSTSTIENLQISQKTKEQLEKRTASYVYRSPRATKRQEDINSDKGLEKRLFEEANLPMETCYFEGQKVEKQHITVTDGERLISNEELTDEQRVKDEAFDKMKEEHKSAVEEHKSAVEEHKSAVEEHKSAVEEHKNSVEEEQNSGKECEKEMKEEAHEENEMKVQTSAEKKELSELFDSDDESLPFDSPKNSTAI